MYTQIVGVGGYLPPGIIYNSEFEASLETTDEWIRQRTGITQRHIAENELTSDLAVKAAKEAGEAAGINLLDIELIIVATTTPDYTFPSCGTIVQSRLGCVKAFAFDVQAACTGFIYALAIANNFIQTGQVKNALVIGSEVMSKIVNWQDRSSCILFGDGAGAVILQSSKVPGIISTHLFSDGNYKDVLYTSGGSGSTGEAGYIVMKGPLMFELAVKKLHEVIEVTLEKNNLSIEEIDFFIPHQANSRILETVSTRLNINRKKIVSTIDIHANTSAASIPLAWNQIKNNITPNSTIMLIGIGAGITWGSALIKT